MPAEFTPFVTPIIVAVLALFFSVAFRYLAEGADWLRPLIRSLKRDDRQAIKEIITGLIRAAEAKYPQPDSGASKYEWVYAEAIKELERRGLKLERAALDPLIHQSLAELKGILNGLAKEFDF